MSLSVVFAETASYSHVCICIHMIVIRIPNISLTFVTILKVCERILVG